MLRPGKPASPPHILDGPNSRLIPCRNLNYLVGPERRLRTVPLQTRPTLLSCYNAPLLCFIAKSHIPQIRSEDILSKI
jgi:hypothetical protein